MRLHKLAVIATIGADGAPQSALIGVGATDALELVFDTLSTTRKHGPGEQTLQYEGVALPVSIVSAEDEVYRQAYYEAWPEGRQHLQWHNLVYWRVVPRWARYSDYDRGPLILEFHWNGQ